MPNKFSINTDHNLNKKAWYLSISIHAIILLIPILSPHETITLTKTPNYNIPIEMVLQEPPQKPKPKLKKKPQAKPKTTTQPRPKKTPKPQPIAYPNDQPNPSIQSSITPVYPKSALNEGLTGKVTVEFTIDTNGKPIQHKIITSSGHTILDNSFIQTVLRYYTFKPKQVNGKKKTSTIRLHSGDAFEL